MGQKRRKGQDEADLPLEPPAPVRLQPEKRAAKEHDLHLKIRARTAVKAAKDEANRKSNGEIDGLDEDIKRIADELLMDTELQKQRDLFIPAGQATSLVATVAARSGHTFVEPAADKIASGEAPRCAFPDCGRFADEAVHVVAPHPYAGENGGPCACGEAKDSPCHQVGADDDEPLMRDPKWKSHVFQDGPLRNKQDVHLCTDCETPKSDAVHSDADDVFAAAPEEAAEGGGARA